MWRLGVVHTSSAGTFPVPSNVADPYGLGDDGSEGHGYPHKLAPSFAGSTVDLD